MNFVSQNLGDTGVSLLKLIRFLFDEKNLESLQRLLLHCTVLGCPTEWLPLVAKT